MKLKQTALFFTCLALSTTTFAHKLNVFSYVEGEQILIEGYFADGKRAQNSKVKIYNDKRELINEGVTNESGQYQYKPATMSEMSIVIDAGMGHVGEYAFKATDAPAPPPNNTSAATTPSAGNAIDQQQLKASVEQAVAKAVEPLTREINELKSKTSFSDIIGGLGFIVGLLGLFAYFKTRKETGK